MREINFRAYDTETKEMNYDFLDNAWLKVAIYSPYVELMQYTGLKDIDGKEVYENDIFTVNKSMGEVIYEEDRFRIRWIRNLNEYNEILRNIVHYVGIAVIGNRFSNPELLEVSTCETDTAKI